MNWLKTSISFVPLLILIIQLIISSFSLKSTIFNPATTSNATLDQFEKVLQISHLSPIGLKYYYSRQEIMFFLKNNINQTTQVILSTNLSPLSQITALQKILETTNIKGEKLTFIDFNSHHPYATFQNN